MEEPSHTTSKRSPILLHPEVTLATSGRNNCYIATTQKKALFVECEKMATNRLTNGHK